MPGAAGKPIPTPKPTTKPGRHPRPLVSGSGGGSSVAAADARTRAAQFLWPVVGGGNYISQYFHYGHYAIDIAADYGSTRSRGRRPAR